MQVASDDGYNGIFNNEVHDYVEPNYMSWVLGRTVELFSGSSYFRSCRVVRGTLNNFLSDHWDVSNQSIR
jgi:hypothetical protein